MSENYYMYDYQEADQDLIDEIGELEDKIEDLELEISRLEDELSNAIQISWIDSYITDSEIGIAANNPINIKRMVEDWRKENGK